MRKCYDCPRACGADRSKDIGFCGGGEYARIVKTINPFTYEEPCLGTVSAVFFGGCNLKCAYCQNKDISFKPCGKVCDDNALAALFDALSDNPLDLVTPTHYLSNIERAIALMNRKPCIIYNTSGYETEGGVRRALGFSDVFLCDFKYADGILSKTLSGASDYPERAIKALKVMREIPDEWVERSGEKILKRGLIVRHLVLPGYVQNSLRVLDIIASELGTDTVISVMSQFTPNGVGGPERKLKKIEYKLVTEHALRLGFKNGYFQDLSSAESFYTPEFDDKT